MASLLAGRGNGRTAQRMACCTALALSVCIWAAPAEALWKHARSVAQGTAQVLERGEIRIGITSPVAYGVLDSLTVETHPILDLLLMPNVAARLRIVDEALWVASLYGGYKQGFFTEAQVHTPGAMVGELHLGAMASLFVLDRLILTGGAGWAGRIVRGDTEGDQDVAPGLAVIAAAHLIASERDLFSINSYLRLDGVDGTLDTPLVTFAWDTDIKGWEAWHFRVGLSIGRFGFRGVTGGPDDRPFNAPVFPTFDLWRRI